MNRPIHDDSNPADLDHGSSLELRKSIRSLPEDRPDPNYRARMREAFVRGDVTAMPKRSARPGSSAPLRSPLRYLVAGAAVAACIVAAVVWNRAPTWSFVSVSGSGNIVVDGTIFAATDHAEWKSRLNSGARVETGDDVQLELRNDDACFLVYTPGTSATIPARSSRWRTQKMNLSVEQGEVRATTGPGFDGTILEFATEEASVIVTGTTVAVIRNAEGTCLCVLEGTSTIKPTSSVDGLRVPAGRRYAVTPHSSSQTLEPLSDMETMKLGMLRDRGNELLSRR